MLRHRTKSRINSIDLPALRAIKSVASTSRRTRDALKPIMRVIALWSVYREGFNSLHFDRHAPCGVLSSRTKLLPDDRAAACCQVRVSRKAQCWIPKPKTSSGRFFHMTHLAIGELCRVPSLTLTGCSLPYFTFSNESGEEIT